MIDNEVNYQTYFYAIKLFSMAEAEVLSPEKLAALARFKGETMPPSKTQQEIDAEEAEKKRIEAEAEEAKKKSQTAPPEATVITDIPEDQLLEAIAKKTGRSIKSWDELKPTPEAIDKEKEQEKREIDKLSFGLKKGFFNKSQYESFISDSKSPISLVYNAELEEAKSADPQWDADKEKEFKEDFDARFGLDLDPTSAKHKRGQKQLGIIAENILRNTYSGILNLENEYSKYESQEKSKSEQHKKVLAAAPIYKKDVEEAMASIKEIEIPFGKDEKYTVKVPDDILQSVQETLMDQDFVKSKILEGYKKEEIVQIAHTMAISQNFSILAYEVAKQYRHKHEKGVRGIPEKELVVPSGDNYEGLSDSQKTAIKFFQPVTTAN